MQLIFVGERRSSTARRKNWTWRDGRLAARPLFEALSAQGVDPAAQAFVNLWTDAATPTIKRSTIEMLRARRDLASRRGHPGVVVVALGRRVDAELARRGVDHVAIVHPAARGRIRKRERYIAHVSDRLRDHVEARTRAG